MGRKDSACMDNRYILFVKKGCVEKVAAVLNEKLDLDRFRAFVPEKETIFRRKGIDHINTKILFPGYVFIET